MTNQKKRLISCILAISLILGLLPGTAWAEGDSAAGSAPDPDTVDAVTFYLNDGNSELKGNGPYMTVAESSAADAQALRPGYKFAGWSEVANGLPLESFTPETGKTYHAQWEQGYKIEFTDEYSETKTASVMPASVRTTTEGKLTSLPNPPKDTNGCHFVGWCLDYNSASGGDGNGKGDLITTDYVFGRDGKEEYTLYAQWVKFITVKFDVRGDPSGSYAAESLTEQDLNIVYPKDYPSVQHPNGAKLDQMPQEPRCSGYNFKGWYIKKNNIDVPLDAETLISAEAGGTEVTVFAKWESFDTGDLYIEGDGVALKAGVDYTVRKGGTPAKTETLVILTTKPVFITSTGNNASEVNIEVGVSGANITLKDVNITATGNPALAIQAGASAAITLDGANVLTGGSGYAGLWCPSDGDLIASVTIGGSGSLTAKGAGKAAGIGGNFTGNAKGVGNITINGNCWVDAQCDAGGTPIGSGIAIAYDKTNGWKGVVFAGDSGEVYGNVTISQPESGQEIASDKKLTINSGTLTMETNLKVSGTLDIKENGKVVFADGVSCSKESTGKINAYSIDCLVGSGLEDSDVDYTVFTMVFDAYGGSFSGGKKTITIKTDTEKNIADSDIPNNPTRANYIFLYWSKKGESSEYTIPPPASPLTENVNLIANWKGEYTITLDVGAGSFTGSRTLKTDKDGKVTTPANPTPPADKDFDGWYTEQTGGDKIDFSSKVFTANTTLYARYTETPPSGGGESGADPASLPQLAAINAPGLVASAAPGIMPVDDSTTPAAPATTVEERVKFYLNTTEADENGELPGEACLTLPKASTGGTQAEPVPYRTGYRWSGRWTADAGNTVTANPGANTLCYAEWYKEIEIEISLGAGTLGAGFKDIANQYPAGKGYKAVAHDKFSDLDELAKYLKELADTIGDEPHANSNKSNYKFLGWYLGNKKEEMESAEIDGDTEFTEENCVIYAKWKKCPPYMIYFILDEGEEDSPIHAIPTDDYKDKDGNLYEGDKAYLTNDKWPADYVPPNETKTHNGYSFNGWLWDNTRMPGVNAQDEREVTDENGEVKKETYYLRSEIVFTDDTYLYADWGAPYLITYNANGGRFGSSEETTRLTDENNGFVDPRADMTILPGHSLEGWETRDEGGENKVYAEHTPVTKPITVYAKWSAPYAITLDAGDGASFDDPSVKNDNGTYYLETDKDGKLLNLPVPKRGDDLFDGWYMKDADGNEVKIELNHVFEAPAVLYAKWAMPYTITFNINSRDGLFLSTNSGADYEAKTELDGRLSVFPEVRRPGSRFLGWYTEKTGGTENTVNTVFTEDTVLYARWQKNPPYEIIFHANGGTFMTGTGKDLTVKTDNEGKLGGNAPADPGLYGSSFTGWRDAAKDGELIAKDQSELKDYAFTDDADLYAQWSNLEYTITFDFNLASVDKNAPVLKRRGLDTTGQVLQITRLPYGFYQEYELTGWYLKADADPEKDAEVKPNGTKFTKGVTVYARWEKSGTYTSKWPTVYFHEEEGKDPSMGLEVWENSRLFVVPDLPAKSGYDFGGWYDGADFIDEDTVFTEDAHVWAKWYKICTVTFNANGGEVDPESGTTVKGKLASLPTPVREGYEFGGWYTAAEKGKKVDLTTEYESDTTLYAHWDGGGGEEPTPPDEPGKPDDPGTTTPPAATGPFTITFDANGGSVSPASTTTGSDGKLSSYPTPRRLGSTFEGWYNGNTLVNTSTVFTSDTTLQARWSGGSGSSGGSSGGTSGYTYTVYTPSNSGGRVSAVPSSAYEGERVTITVRPNSGYEVSNVTVTDSRGREVTVRSSGNDTYYFYMPPYNVTVDADFTPVNGSNTTTPTTPTPTPTTPTTPTTPGTGATSGDGVFSAPVMTTLPMPYTDVPQSAWYYTSVDYMWKRSLMGGVSATQFGPGATTSKAMIWTILARLSGVDMTAGGVWYETARSWAMSNGISDGADPNSPVTREELVTMMWRYSGSPAVSYDLGRFADRGQIATYQGDNAFRWAAAQGLVNGDSSRLNPQGTATRAEVAAIMTRFCQSR